MHLNLRDSFLWKYIHVYKHVCVTRQSTVLVSFHTFFAFIQTTTEALAKSYQISIWQQRLFIYM